MRLHLEDESAEVWTVSLVQGGRRAGIVIKSLLELS